MVYRTLRAIARSFFSNFFQSSFSEIKNNKFHQNKNPILISNKDTNKTVASNKVSSSKIDVNYFIVYKTA